MIAVPLKDSLLSKSMGRVIARCEAILGLAQVADNILDSNLLPAVEFIEALEEARFNFCSLLLFLVACNVLSGSWCNEIATEFKYDIKERGRAGKTIWLSLKTGSDSFAFSVPKSRLTDLLCPGLDGTG